MLKPIAPKFKPDPIVIEGKVEGNIPIGEIVKGKEVKGKCEGYSSSHPTYLLPLPQNFPYLNVKVQGEGLILLVQGPDGVFCRQENPELSGMWTAGTYQIWIGTKQRTKTKFRLSFSEMNQ
ncbi:MAG: hypothetical protein RMK91_06480 [Pseudanabaenaceae cyanobacterium SKYGB_i_bin29]|nr:hypothetical protein [Pseudanabaenaceae cyanobacterium SKYG29]MDW8421498.1 hypothetical protein [Pseudanabaenaceae cyanobacterium SKYGB_i_bin29]